MIISAKEIENTPFQIVAFHSITKMSIEEIQENIFGYLQDYDNWAFKFIKFPDEQVQLKKDNEFYEVFGRCGEGIFIQDQKNTIWLISFSKDFSENLLIYVNSSLENFLQSYSLYMSKIFILKSQVFNQALLEKTATQEAMNFSNSLSIFDPEAMIENNFWYHYTYYLEDLVIKLSLPLADYIEAERF